MNGPLASASAFQMSWFAARIVLKDLVRFIPLVAFAVLFRTNSPIFLTLEKYSWVKSGSSKKTLIPETSK